MAADPPLMLMDEPFGAIDPITRERLQNDFLRLHREIRKTVVFVTHDIDEAIKMGDRICHPARGRRARPVRHAGGDPRRARPTSSWPSSWAPTAASSGSRCASSTRSTCCPVPSGDERPVPRTSSKTTLRDALSLMLTEGSTGVVVRRRGRSADGLHDVRRGQPPALGIARGERARSIAHPVRPGGAGHPRLRSRGRVHPRERQLLRQVVPRQLRRPLPGRASSSTSS